VNVASRLLAASAPACSGLRRLGGMVVLLLRVLWRSCRRASIGASCGATSTRWRRERPIVALTALFCGGIMVIQASIFVRRFNAYSMVGWGRATASSRGRPILIGLMFSAGGSNNTAELGR